MKEKELADYTSVYQLARRQAVLLKGLNVAKAWNALRCLYEYVMRKSVLRSYPLVLRLEPTSHCNLRCPTCHPNGNTFGGEMQEGVFQALLDRIPFAHFLKGSLYLYGEPLFNKRLPAMIAAVGERNVPTSISTNFNLFSEKKANEIIDAGLSWIIICLDGADQETYAKYRVGGRLDRVLKNIETMVEVKRQRGTSWPIIEVQCIEFDYNAHQIDQMRRMCLDLGVERFTTKRDVLSQMNIDFTSLDDEDEAPMVEASPKRGTRCMYLYGTMHVDSDGSVLPCCVGRTPFGNLLEETFEEIWNNEKFVAAREFFASGFVKRNEDLDIPCYTCPLFFPEAGRQADRVASVRPDTVSLDPERVIARSSDQPRT